MEKLKLEGKQNYRNTQNANNRGNFKRPNNSPQVLQRDQRNRDMDDQNFQPLSKLNLLVMKKERMKKLIQKSIVLVTPLHLLI